LGEGKTQEDGFDKIIGFCLNIIPKEKRGEIFDRLFRPKEKDQKKD